MVTKKMEQLVSTFKLAMPLYWKEKKKKNQTNHNLQTWNKMREYKVKTAEKHS